MGVDVFLPRHAAPDADCGERVLVFDGLTAPANAMRRRSTDRAAGTAVVTRAGRMAFVSEQLGALLGWSPTTLKSMEFRDLVVGSTPEALGVDGLELWVLRRADGTEVPALVSVEPIRDSAGTPVCAVISVQGLESAPANGEPVRSADPELYAPSHLERQIADALVGAGGTHGPVGVLRLDIDGFPLLRERYGEQVGAFVSRAVVQRMCQTLPLDVTVGQLTGGEFGVLVVGRAPEQLLDMATGLLRAIAEPMCAGDAELLVTVSIGASVAEPSSTTETLTGEAGEALQRARRRGGDRCELFDDAMRSRSADRAALAEDLRSALLAKEIDVAYQPIITVEGGLAGVEALVRWVHPTRGNVSSAHLINVAEESGLIHDLGRHVLQRATADVARWRLHQANLTVSVNLSGLQLVRTNIAVEIERTLAAAGVDPQALDLEITESVLMEDPAAATASLTQLRAKGVQITIDDFGTGCTSLLYLRRFPLRRLKLDRLLIADINTDPQNREIVGFVVQLAHALGLAVVAEGVESVEQLDGLKALGCDLMQGSYWGRPQPADRIDVMVAAGRALVGNDAVEPASATAAVDSDVRQPGLGPELRHRVVLVDDSAGQRNLTRLALEGSRRYVVVGEAATADIGVTMARQYRPDLVVLDLAMPGRNGLEIVPELLAASPGAEVVISSGYLSNGSAAQARSMGAAACVDKYLPAEDLISQLDAVM
jgi:diguanylate cyclase (GGDEF)-like protein/PAS domain S-box-containing protein